MTNLLQSWPQQPTNDLRVDSGYRENLSGQSVNAKLAGILPQGVYHGFDVSASTGLKVDIGSSGVNSALIEVTDPVNGLTSSLTASMPVGMTKELEIPVGAQCYAVLKVFYRVGAGLEVSQKTSISIEVVTDLTEPDYTSYLVLASINVPSGTAQISQSHILGMRKIDLGTEQEASFNELTGAANKTYTIARGSGALAGEFSLYDTETGGFLKLVAIHTRNGKASLTVTAKSESMPITRLSIVDSASGIELRASIEMKSSGAERIYSDFRAFDAHNDSGIGWVQSFIESVAGGTELAAVDTVFKKNGVGDKTVPSGLGSAGFANSGMVTEHNKPLAQRYLGIESKAVSAVSADSASYAATSGNSSKLGGVPSSHIGMGFVDHDGQYKDSFPKLSSDPDLLTVPFAVIKHTNNPTGSASYYVETRTHKHNGEVKRYQKAVLVINDASEASESASQDGVFYRWLSGNPSTPSSVKKSKWDSKRDHESWQGVLAIGGDDSNISTDTFLDILVGLGAFYRGHWICRGSWGYSTNNNLQLSTTDDKGNVFDLGKIELAGCVIEVYGTSKVSCTIRIVTPTTSTYTNGSTDSEFIYVSNEGNVKGAYSPKWRKISSVGTGDHQLTDNKGLSTTYATKQELEEKVPEGSSLSDTHRDISSSVTDGSRYSEEISASIKALTTLHERVKTDVPLNAVFTDTVTQVAAALAGNNKGSTGVAASIAALHTLNDRVKTDVPLNAVFKDTVTLVAAALSEANRGSTGVAASIAALHTLNDRVKTDVPKNAVFKDTVTLVSESFMLGDTAGISGTTAASLKSLALVYEYILDNHLKTNVPEGALFSDTVTLIASELTSANKLTNSEAVGTKLLSDKMLGIYNALDARVKTNVPENALFTDTNTHRPIATLIRDENKDSEVISASMKALNTLNERVSTYTRPSAAKASHASRGAVMFASLYDGDGKLPFSYNYGSIITLSPTMRLRPAGILAGANQGSPLPEAGTKWVCQGYSRYANDAMPHHEHAATLWARWDS